MIFYIFAIRTNTALSSSSEIQSKSFAICSVVLRLCLRTDIVLALRLYRDLLLFVPMCYVFAIRTGTVLALKFSPHLLLFDLLYMKSFNHSSTVTKKIHNSNVRQINQPFIDKFVIGFMQDANLKRESYH